MIILSFSPSLFRLASFFLSGSIRGLVSTSHSGNKMAAYTCQRSLASCFRRKAVTSVLLPSTVRSPSNIRSPRHVLPAVRFYSSGSGKLSHGKQITPKPNPLSWQAKYKKLRLATPLDQKEKEIVGDTSKVYFLLANSLPITRA